MLKDYEGIPFEDERHQGRPQVVPGKVMCAFYDIGGEGIAYHDTIKENQGNGKLNPPNGEYKNEFRMSESVDTSFIKPFFDHTDKNFARPDLELFYVGWTEEGEWLNYTIDVRRTGKYQVDFLFSAAKDAAISLSIDGENLTGEIAIPSTTHPHIWDRYTNMAELELEEGLHVLTLKTEKVGLMNYAYLEFVYKRQYMKSMVMSS